MNKYKRRRQKVLNVLIALWLLLEIINVNKMQKVAYKYYLKSNQTTQSEATLKEFWKENNIKWLD